jgi:hypothetical protein
MNGCRILCCIEDDLTPETAVEEGSKAAKEPSQQGRRAL